MRLQYLNQVNYSNDWNERILKVSKGYVCVGLLQIRCE